MKIESIHLKNYKSFRSLELDDLPSVALFVGANGSGKSTLLEVFGFLRDSLKNYVRQALQKRGGQVFISTHSTDLLNNAELNEVYWMIKKNGFTQVLRAQDDEMISSLVREGNQLGYLWKQVYFTGSHTAK